MAGAYVCIDRFIHPWNVLGENHINARFQFQRLSLLFIFPVLISAFDNQKTIRYSAIAFLTTNLISAIIAILINIGCYLIFQNIFLSLVKTKMLQHL